LFVATPPLEALKLLISMAMTEGIGYQRGKGETGHATGVHIHQKGIFTMHYSISTKKALK
jgi:hypothetical protein